MKRYERQLLLPEIGVEGQQKLKESSVLIVGVGGLGSAVALYLIGAGIGTVGLIDDDVVSLTNLHRQVLYRECEIGLSKVSCASKRLRELNNEVEIIEYNTSLTPENASQIIRQYDLVIDGCDNQPTRYLMSDVCASLHIPYIYGAIEGFCGQVAIFCCGENAKVYRDLFPEEISDNESCTPIIGPTSSMIASMQCSEAIKLIVGCGTSLVNKLWNINLLTLETHLINF